MAELIVIKIVGAAILSTILGFVWFHPRAFGAIWMRHARITPEMAERGKRRVHLYALAGFIGNAIAAYVLFYLLAAFQISLRETAITLALLVWVGFTAPSLLGMMLWEQKPLSYYSINALYWLVSLVIMAMILVL
ncbi:MAG: hypothetical protein UY63_C0005G0032 [Parcubacteria group bacterium GW2011_GWA2_51_10]|nr:MAG: hypothetical protein UY63_C0005G0032 [Parcubacteria group bacterium GW2011_GWA2_51_10]